MRLIFFHLYEAYFLAKQYLNNHKDTMNTIVHTLLEKEILLGTDVTNIIKNNTSEDI